MFNQNPYYEPFSLKESFKRIFAQKSALSKLILINVIVYFAFLFFKLFVSLGAFLFNSDFDEVAIQWVISKLACPASLTTLLYQPWSLLTDIFFHVEFWHLFFNMLMLWVAGRIFVQYLSEKKLVITYLAGGVCGNLLYIAAYNTFPVFADNVDLAMALGASGSIMAILVAITVYQSNHELHFFILPRHGLSIRLIWVTIIFLIIDLMSIPHGNAGGHIAHLGGAIYGALSVFFLTKNFSFPKREKRKKKKYSTSFDTATSQRPLSDEEYNYRKKQQEDKLDAILDKISASGYDALTKEEKEFLFFTSKRKNNE